MTSIDKIIFVVGLFATLLMSGGLLFTIHELREMGKHADRFMEKSGLTREKTSEAKAVSKG